MSRKDYDKVCGPHRIGVGPGTPPFFYDWCRVCQQKKRDGKVKGDEGPVRDPNHHTLTKRMSAKQVEGKRQDRLRNLVPVGRR